MHDDISFFEFMTTFLLLVLISGIGGGWITYDYAFEDGKCEGIYGTGSISQYGKCLSPTK